VKPVIVNGLPEAITPSLSAPRPSSTGRSGPRTIPRSVRFGVSTTSASW
jgi:hypothetical protein